MLEAALLARGHAIPAPGGHPVGRGAGVGGGAWVGVGGAALLLRRLGVVRDLRKVGMGVSGCF